VFGDGVEESERFTNRLEAIEPTWRVDNLGMTGYGPDLMLMALEEIGLTLKPDVVVFTMYTDDFRRVHPYQAGLGFKIPRLKLEYGQLVRVAYPELKLWERMHVFQVVYRFYWHYSDSEWKLNRGILDRFLELAEEYDFMPGIIFLPGTADTRNDKRRRGWLRQYAEHHGTRFLDVTGPIHKAGRNNVFIANNWHLNPYGHQIVATELRDFLVDWIVKTPK